MIIPSNLPSISLYQSSELSPFKKCAQRMGLSQETIEKVVQAVEAAGIDTHGPIGNKFNAQHMIGIRLGFSIEDVLSDWYSPFHRDAAENGAAIEDLRGANRDETYGLYHGLKKEEVHGLTTEQICTKVDKKIVKQLIEYALEYGLTEAQLARISTPGEFHARIAELAGITEEDRQQSQRLAYPSKSFIHFSFIPLALLLRNQIDPVKEKMERRFPGFSPPSFYRRGV